jgi:uncharacterized protein (TIGR03435 family)
MPRLVDKLPWIAFDYMDRPVVDRTKLKGSWDLVVSFSPARVMGTSSVEPGGASDPTGRMTVFEALASQLGLKREASKAPMPVLVVDHADEKPADN